MKRAVTLLSIFGLAFVAMADPKIGQPALNFTATDIYSN